MPLRPSGATSRRRQRSRRSSGSSTRATTAGSSSSLSTHNLHPMPSWAIGIDLGGTNIKTAVVDEAKGILFEESQPTDSASGPDSVVRQMALLASEHYQRATEQ